MLCLRQPRSVDVDAIAAIAGDPRTSEHIPAGALTVVASRGLVRDWIEDWASDAVGYWVVEEPNSGAVIGWGGVRFVAAADVRLLNLAYRFARSHWVGASQPGSRAAHSRPRVRVSQRRP